MTENSRYYGARQAVPMFAGDFLFVNLCSLPFNSITQYLFSLYCDDHGGETPSRPRRSPPAMYRRLLAVPLRVFFVPKTDE
jgi:hypothetical protein